MNKFGGCSRQSQTSFNSNAQATTCRANQFKSNGKCVGSCGIGFYPDYTSRQCLPCSNNCDTCFTPSFCVVCAAGFAPVAGACHPVKACGQGQLDHQGTCVNECPSGTYSDTKKCNRICDPNTYYFDRICYISCPSGLRTADACVTQCPAGFMPNNGVCL